MHVAHIERLDIQLNCSIVCPGTWPVVHHMSGLLAVYVHIVCPVSDLKMSLMMDQTTKSKFSTAMLATARTPPTRLSMTFMHGVAVAEYRARR